MIKEIQLQINLVEEHKENILLYKVSKQLLQVAEEKVEYRRTFNKSLQTH